MTWLKFLSSIARLFLSFFDWLKIQGYVKHGEAKAQSRALTEQQRRVEKARSVRRSVRLKSDRMRDNDPYQRD